MRYADTVCVVLNYNDADTTAALVSRLHPYQSIDKIIIVDNASTDDSAEKLSKLVGEKTVLIRGGRNGGYGYGNNLGIHYASKVFRAKYALIANPDTEFSEEAVLAMRAAFSRSKTIAAAAPLMRNENDAQSIPGSRRNRIGGPAAWPLRPWLYDLLESEPVMRRMFSSLLHYGEAFYQKSDLLSVGALAGALVMLDVEKVISCGAYDERVFLYGEENILGRRLRAKHYRSVLLRDHSYRHIHSKSITRSFISALKRQRLRERSALIYYRKYLKINALQYLISKLVFKIVELEILVWGLFSGYR